MFAMYLLEEASSGSGSIWVPVIVLGWFVIMTLVGSQVSRRNPPVTESHPENPPSEFDTH